MHIHRVGTFDWFGYCVGKHRFHLDVAWKCFHLRDSRRTGVEGAFEITTAAKQSGERAVGAYRAYALLIGAKETCNIDYHTACAASHNLEAFEYRVKEITVESRLDGVAIGNHGIGLCKMKIHFVLIFR